MSPEHAIRSRLLTSAALVALIGDRISPSLSSEIDDLPRVVYTLIAADPQIHMGGASGLTFSRIQFDVFAATVESAWAVRDAIRDRIHGFRGTITDGAESRFFGVIYLEDEQDQPTDPTDGTDVPIFGRSLDFFFSTSDPIPTLTA